MFIQNQTKKNKDNYIDYLKIAMAIDFSQKRKNIKLHYKDHEDIFALSFNGLNISDIHEPIDMVQNNIGIGLKTFIINSENSQYKYEKIAEFVIDDDFKLLSEIELIKGISTIRNKKLLEAKKNYNLKRLMYHCITRYKNKFFIVEEDMDLIDIKNITIIQSEKNSISFNDKKNNYKFSKSKSVLFKEFSIDRKLQSIEVEKIHIKELFQLLKEKIEKKSKQNKYKHHKKYNKSKAKKEIDNKQDLKQTKKKTNDLLKDFEDIYIKEICELY